MSFRIEIDDELIDELKRKMEGQLGHEVTKKQMRSWIELEVQNWLNGVDVHLTWTMEGLIISLLSNNIEMNK